METIKHEAEECCPTFHSEKWDNKTLNWKNKHFIKASVPTLFHIPFQKMLGKKITKMMKQVEDSNKMALDKEDVLLLFTDPHPFRSDIYLSTTDTIPNAKNTTISGTFMAKVFDGPYKDILKFFREMDTYLMEQNKKAENYFVHYAYCPKCSEDKGHNYMVLFAQIKNN